MTDLKYPIGEFSFPQSTTAAERTHWIQEIGACPALVRAAVEGLSEEQLDTPYRPGGWTARQVVHHMADSHLNSYVRFRLALTEDNPTIKPYDEGKWAMLPDAVNMPVQPSLALLDGLHGRWTRLLQAMTDADFARSFHHPEMGIVRLEQNLAMYAWHGKHHTAHIQSVR